jgi:hypothetical protein
MGHGVAEIRSLRAENIGSEVSTGIESSKTIHRATNRMTDFESLDSRRQGMVLRYARDMNAVIKECERVLKYDGRAIFVVGDSAIRGVFVKNSAALMHLAESHGMNLTSRANRPLETQRRYLPPPESERAGGKMQSRMREEVILQFAKGRRSACQTLVKDVTGT